MSGAFHQRYCTSADPVRFPLPDMWTSPGHAILQCVRRIVQALLQSSHMYYDAKKHFGGHGVVVGDLNVDLPKMMEQKTKSVDSLTKGIEGLFKKNKIKYVKGWGSFVSPTEVKVALSDGGEETISTKNVMIATGSEPSSIPGLDIDEDRWVAA